MQETGEQSSDAFDGAAPFLQLVKLAVPVFIVTPLVAASLGSGPQLTASAGVAIATVAAAWWLRLDAKRRERCPAPQAQLAEAPEQEALPARPEFEAAVRQWRRRVDVSASENRIRAQVGSTSASLGGLPIDSALVQECRKASGSFLVALSHLHDCADVASEGDASKAREKFDLALVQISESSDHLTAMSRILVHNRGRLAEGAAAAAEAKRTDPDGLFRELDYEAIYRELVFEGAAMPQRVFWDDVVQRLKADGARGGLRLLDRHVRELQSDLRTLEGELATICNLPPVELGRALHEGSHAVAVLIMGLTRFLACFQYLKILFEKTEERSVSIESGEELDGKAAG